MRGYITSKMTNDKEFEKFLGKLEDIEWYANNVPYHITQKNIDILVFHKNFRYTNAPLRYKYSVIELKMLEDILSDKAEDRRKLLEEAAGVTKYKHRLKAAVRKLDATRNDLLRVNDIIGEVERSVS